MKNNVLTITVAIALAALLVLVSDPFMLWMPPRAQMIALLCAAALACAWAGLVLYERPRDEREAEHSMFAGRAAYLTGVCALTLALAVEGLSHALDPWVPLSLGAMVMVKLAAHLYSERFR